MLPAGQGIRRRPGGRSAGFLPAGNRRGGAGKSTTTVNLGIGLAKQGKRVLLLDCDSQGSLTASLGFRKPSLLEPSVATVMASIIEEDEIQDPILHHREGVDLVPVQAAKLALDGMQELIRTIGKLRRHINPELTIEGILLTMVNPRTKYARETMEMLRKSAPAPFAETRF